MQRVSKERFAREAEKSVASLAFYDGVLETIEKLATRGKRMGVVTNLPRWLVVPMLVATEIDEYFETVVTPGRGVRSKPSAQGVLKALREMEEEPDGGVWFVGDSVADAKAAARADISFAWASYGYEDVAPGETGKELGRFGEVLEL